MFSQSLSFLLLALSFSISGIVADDDKSESSLSRIDILERRIESLEKLARTQSEAIEGLLRRNLQSTSNNGCLPKRNSDNVCVYEDDVEFLFQNASLVFDSSTVRFTGPILEYNNSYCEGNVTNLGNITNLGNATNLNLKVCEGKTINITNYEFSSRVIFETTDVLVDNSNVSITAEHNYTAFETNRTNITQFYGFVNFNNTEVALNSSRFLVTGPDPRDVNQSLYDNITYANLFSSVGFSFSNIMIEDSNTTFTTNSSSGTDESKIVFNHTTISHNYTYASFTGSFTNASDSSVVYGSNTNVQWDGDSSAAYFTNGVEVNINKSNVVMDDAFLELKGNEGRFVSRVDTLLRGPDKDGPIDFVVSRRVNVRFEQNPTMIFQSDVHFLSGSEITVDNGAALVIDGKLESNDESEFHGDIHMVDVKLNVDGRLLIDGEDGESNNADIEFRRGVDVRFYNDLHLDSNLDVAGRSYLDSLDVAEVAKIGGRLYCRKGASISGDSSSYTSMTSMYSSELLKVEGSIYVQRDLEVDRTLTSGTHIFEGDVIVKGNTRASSLTVDSTAKISGTTTLRNFEARSGSVSGHITVESGSFEDVTVSQKANIGAIVATNATVNNELQAGEATITRELTARTIKAESDVSFRNLDVSERATIRNLDVTGATKLYSLTVTSNTHIDGTTTLGSLSGSSGSFTGRLTAGSMRSDSSLSSTNLAVSGKTTTESLGVTSDADVGGDLSVGGTTKLDSTVFVDLTVLGTASVDVLSASSATISGASTVQTLSVNSNATIGGALSVAGTTDLANAGLDDVVIRGSAAIADLAADSASISGAATVQTLTVNANANVVGDLSIEGSTELDETVFRDLKVIGRATVGSLTANSVTVAGKTALQSLSVNANAIVGGNLDVNGSTELSSTVFQDISVLGNMAVAGKGTFGSLGVSSNVDIGGNMNVGGATEFDSTVFKDITVLGTASVDNLAASAFVTGSATVENLSVNSNTSIGGNLNVEGATELTTTVFQDIRVPGTATIASLSASSAAISGSATIETLSVNADANIGGGLNIAGSMELDDTTFRNIKVLGRATMDSLSASSAVISGTATVDTLIVNSNSRVEGDMEVSGTIEMTSTVFQNISVLGTAEVNSLSASSADISGSLHVDAGANIRGNLNVGGSTELAATIFQDISVLGTASVEALSASSATINGALTVSDDANVGGGLNVVGSLELHDTTFRNINVVGRATMGSLSASSASISGTTTTQTLSVDADIDVRGDLNVEGSFAATRKEALFNNVAIAGTAIVGNISCTNSTLGNLTVSGNASVIGNLDVQGVFEPRDSRFSNIDVSGTATVGSLRATSSASIEGQVTARSLRVDDNADVMGDVNVAGSMELASTIFQELSVVGRASVGSLFAGSADIKGEARVQSLNVHANADVTGSLSVAGSTLLENTVFQDISILGNAEVDSLTARTASIANTATIGSLMVNNDADVTGGLSVAGTFSPADSEFQDISVVGTASVNSLVATAASVSDTATIQTLRVSADADVSGGLNVGGNFRPADSEFQDITVVGTASIGALSASTASIDNTATIQTLIVSGNADVSLDLTLGGSFSSDVLECQDINVSGTASVGSLMATTASVDSVASIETLSVGGSADIAGDLTVVGTVIN